MSTPLTKSKEPRELAARALCRFDGQAEDIKVEGKPMWESYLPKADAVLAAVAVAPHDGQLEHVPVRAYHVLRRLSQGSIPTDSMHGVEDRGLAAFLVSRGLAVEVGGKLKITVAGKAIGEIEDER